jgi:hypothetical protein
MHDEVVRIWAREGIHVSWRTREDDVPGGGRFVRLMLLEGHGSAAGGAAHPSLGQFLPDERRIRVSMVAAAGAARVAAAGHTPGRGTTEYQRALGYVLGRAVAHELGHALLGTRHSEDGLMVAAFDPRAIADGRSDRFRLSATDAARLADGSHMARVASREPDLSEHTADADLLLAR